MIKPYKTIFLLKRTPIFETGDAPIDYFTSASVVSANIQKSTNNEKRIQLLNVVPTTLCTITNTNNEVIKTSKIQKPIGLIPQMNNVLLRFLN